MKIATKIFKYPLFWGFAFFAFLFFCATAFWVNRGDWLFPEQTQAGAVLNENLAEVTIGQSFVASQAGLQAIEIEVDLSNTLSGQLVLHLRNAPDASQDIQLSTVSLPDAVSADGWIRFPIEVLPDSHAKYYYFFIESEGVEDGRFPIQYGPPESYFNGAMYVNGKPQEGQLTFRLSYNRAAMLTDLAKGIGASTGRGLLVMLVFTLPGWALLMLFQLKRERRIVRHWVEGVSVAIGLSLSSYVIIFLWANWVNLHLGGMLVWLIVAISAAFLIWHYRVWQLRLHNVLSAARTWSESDTVWADSATIMIVLVAATARLLMVRGLDMPLWDDSVQHAVITQRIIESGGLFQSWLPYSPHTTFSFHFGFHINSAVFAWVTGFDAPQAMLWGGQLFNLFAVLTLYAMAYRLKGAWAGAIVVLAAGILMEFPLFYMNWGRYPQLMGQVILPTAIWWTWVTLNDHQTKLHRNLPWIISGGFLIVGSALSYYRMAFHYVLFVMAAGIVVVKSARDLLDWRRWRTLGITAVTAFILIFPWFFMLATRLFFPRAGAGAPTSTEPVAASAVQFDVYGVLVAPLIELWPKIEALSIDFSLMQMFVLLLGVIVVVWGGRKAALPIIWMLILICLPILSVTSLPGAYLIEAFTIRTSLYMPLSLIGSVVFSNALSRFSLRWQPIVVMFVILLSLSQLPRMMLTLDREFDLTSRPDMHAAAWINEHLPEDAFFLVNGFEYRRSPAGSDAGWWLPILTKRQTTIPPQYASFVEEPLTENYRQLTTELILQLYNVPKISDEDKALICRFPDPITHVYIGQKRGEVDKALYTHNEQVMLLPQAFLDDAAFTLIYNRDRVMIFEFDRGVCVNG